MTAHSKVGLSSLLGLVLCSLAAVGAPPSEFVQEPGVWLRLEPLMFPALFLGVVLALLALVLSLVVVRPAAVTCVGAVAASMVGVTVAWGIDAEASARSLVLPLGFLALPALGAVEALRQLRRAPGASGEGRLEQSAG